MDSSNSNPRPQGTGIGSSPTILVPQALRSPYYQQTTDGGESHLNLQEQGARDLFEFFASDDPVPIYHPHPQEERDLMALFQQQPSNALCDDFFACGPIIRDQGKLETVPVEMRQTGNTNRSHNDNSGITHAFPSFQQDVNNGGPPLADFQGLDPSGLSSHFALDFNPQAIASSHCSWESQLMAISQQQSPNGLCSDYSARSLDIQSHGGIHQGRSVFPEAGYLVTSPSAYHANYVHSPYPSSHQPNGSQNSGFTQSYVSRPCVGYVGMDSTRRVHHSVQECIQEQISPSGVFFSPRATMSTPQSVLSSLPSTQVMYLRTADSASYIEYLTKGSVRRYGEAQSSTCSRLLSCHSLTLLFCAVLYLLFSNFSDPDVF
ncbi:hypothetical protein VKT23_004540 [Stygiomarasmius scandens]|uniref:Uncharacterized protein n=1 Tax=Marasmiellus scandens TaxID=2682957 RepID=A0ABR1JVY5_9AGAR